MSADMNVQDLRTLIEPVPIVRKAKLDPTKNTLSNFIDGSVYHIGDRYIYDQSAIDKLKINTTTASHSESRSSVLVAEFGTSVTKYRRLWDSVPTIEDYFELDAITDADETENAFYKASEEFGW
jgi:hypothetical protein